MAALVGFTSNAEIDRSRAEQSALISQSKKPYIPRLVAYVHDCFEEAREYKDQVITPRLLDCLRRRKGEYDPLKLAELKSTGGSVIWMQLTDIKCRTAEAWIKDTLMSAGDRPWTLEPTPIPELMPELAAQVTRAVQIEAQLAMANGVQLHPLTILHRANELYDQSIDEIKRQADIAAERMATKIEDQFAEGKFRDSLSEFLIDFCTYPTAFLKGAIKRPKLQLQWGAGWVPMVVKAMVDHWPRVSPFDIYPAPAIGGIDQGYLIERRYFNRRDLSAMRGMQGYNTEALEAVIARYGHSGLQNFKPYDTERHTLEDRRNLWASPTRQIEGREFSGPVPGDMLIQWGMNGIDPWEDYEANVIVIGEYAIRAVINPDPLKHRGYYCASFERIPGSIWGRAIPEQMTDIQDGCNGAARALMDNLGIASGPQVEVYTDRLPDNAKITQMYPWKIWQTRSSRNGSNDPAVRFFQPDALIEPLTGLIDKWEVKSDERTGIPRYAYGSQDLGGAAKTMGGLSMLMGNTAKGIKQAIVNCDQGVIEPAVERQYHYNMINDEDRQAKSDLKVVARGAAALIIKEVITQRRADFLNSTNNPIDMAIIGIEGRAAVLREQVRTLDMPVDDVVPSRDMIIQKVQAQQAAALAQGQPNQPPPQGGQQQPGA